MRRCRPIRVHAWCYDGESGELELYPHEHEDRADGWIGIAMPQRSAEIVMAALARGEAVKIRGRRFRDRDGCRGPNHWSRLTSNPNYTRIAVEAMVQAVADLAVHEARVLLAAQRTGAPA